MEPKDQYSQAHLVVSAIRVLEHQHNAPPSIEEICKSLSYTLEQGHMVCRKLEELGIIKIVEGVFGTRLSVEDHLAIEQIPRGVQESLLDKQLKAFQTNRKERSKEIESFRAKQEEKKKALFAEIEKKLKDQTSPKPAPSTDGPGNESKDDIGD